MRPQQVGFLEERGADTSGEHEDLVERLAAIFAPELDRELQREEEEATLSSAASGRGLELDDGQLQALVQRRASRISEELQPLSRAQLYNVRVWRCRVHRERC